MEVLRHITNQGNGIKIYEDTDWFSTTTDSVILSEFAHVKLKDKRILDLGSGVGTIPLLLALQTNAKIDGVEIQQDVFNLSQKSILENHLEHQIHLHCLDIKEAPTFFGKESFDLIVSNPPYFTNRNKKVMNLDKHKQYARHEVAITFEQLVKVAKELLKDHGRFVFIHRTERCIEILETLKKYQMEPKRLQFVYYSKESSSKLFLLEVTKYGKKELKILPPLYINERERSCDYAKKL